MDADLVLIIIASLVTLTVVPWVLFSGIAKVRRASTTSGGNGLRRSDLEAIVRAAVEDANEPVLRRLDALEAPVPGGASGRIHPAVVAEAFEEAPPDRAASRTPRDRALS